jgi:DNA-directed RNA polymerase sigma subunit (sigma70/sigma32)
MLQRINRARKEVSKEIGRTPSSQELAQYLEVSVEELEKYTSRTRNVVSLESPLRAGGSLEEDRRTIGDLIVSDAPTPEEDVHRKSLKDDIQAVINELAEREREVLILRFGLENGEPMTVTQTAKQLDISVDRVRLVESRALNKLRNPQTNYRLKEYMGDQTTEEEQIIEEVESAPEKIWFF